MLASNIHLGEALEIQGVKDAESPPPEAHILVKERDGELTTLGQAVKKKKTITRERLFLDKMIWKCLWWRPVRAETPKKHVARRRRSMAIEGNSIQSPGCVG